MGVVAEAVVLLLRVVQKQAKLHPLSPAPTRRTATATAFPGGRTAFGATSTASPCSGASAGRPDNPPSRSRRRQPFAAMWASRLRSTRTRTATAARRKVRAGPHRTAAGASPSDTVEASAALFDLVTFYTRNLGVAARRDVGEAQVLEGKRLFYETNCIGCHRPKFVTRRDSIGEEQSFQLIWPYADLLLHDMGDGLADGRPEGEASGRECPRRRHRRRHRQVLQAPPRQGVPRLPEGDRPKCPGRAGHPRRHGQLRHPQDGSGEGLAGAASALARPLHADLRFLDQPGRTLVRRTDAQAVAARRAHLDPPASKPTSAPSSNNTTKTPSPSSGPNPPTTSSPPSNASASVSMKTYATNFRFRWTRSVFHFHWRPLQ